MEKIEIDKNDLINILILYDEDNSTATPLNLNSFIEYIFILYHRERLNPKDEKIMTFQGINREINSITRKAEIFVCDSPNSEYK
jgi:hypothetical protein